MLDGAHSLEDLVRRSAEAERSDDAWDMLVRFLRDRGMGAVAFVSSRAVRTGAAPRADGFGAWPSLYRSVHAGADPGLVQSGMSPKVIPWSELANVPLPPTAGSTESRSAHDFVEDLQREGGGDGLFFPMWGPEARVSYSLVGFGGPARPLTAGDIAEMHVALFNYNIEAVAFEAVPRVPRLSPREREVLMWMARGRSNAAIAEVMAVSYHTVDTMVRRIFAKLDASDRTSATVRGLALGAIQIEDVV